jgi:hypothetical protein
MLIMPMLNESHAEAHARTAPQLGSRKRDAGSWPIRAPSVLRDYYESCLVWCDWNLAPNEYGRRAAFNAWLYQHGEAWIDAHYGELCAILDALETRAREDGRA